VRPLDSGGCGLVITAQSESFEGSQYTSARIKTLRHPVAGAIEPPRHADGRYVDGGRVRVEARMQLPQGTVAGTWPAFWMLPSVPVQPALRLAMNLLLYTVLWTPESGPIKSMASMVSGSLG
jgi:hypothetical protein